MQKLKKHGIINITILYGGIFAGFVNTILKAKTFTPEEIGVLSIIFTFASVAGHFIRFGTPAGLIKYYFNFKESIEQKTGFVLFNLFINITICIIACIIFLLIQPWLLDKYSNLLLKRYINFTFLFFVGNMLNNFFKEIFIAEKKTIHSTLIGDVLIRILRLGGILFFYIQDIAFSYYFLFEVAILFILSFWFLVIIKQIKLALPVFNFAKPGFLSEYFAYLLFMFFANVATILINSI